MAKPPSKAPGPQPEGRLRLSQAMGAFGPGALVDLVKDAVLISGLDHWKFRQGRMRAIHEPRLREQLAPRLQQAGRALSVDQPFFAPPEGDERLRGDDQGVPAFEFPSWFVCQRDNCRSLQRTSSLNHKGGRYQHKGDDGETHDMVPVRFVGACRRGHLEEFPWPRFVHQGSKESCGGSALQLVEGQTGDFAEVEVRCTACKARRRLIDAKVVEKSFGCKGLSPWLGQQSVGDTPPCPEPLSLLVRSASNSYFPQIVSALSIPEDTRLADAVERHWRDLKEIDAGGLTLLQKLPSYEALKPFAVADLLAEIRARAAQEQSGTNSRPRPPLRTAEYLQLLQAPDERPGELPSIDKEEDRDFFARRLVPSARQPLPAGIERVVLLSKLREVRAQVGLTRVEPLPADLQGNFDLGERVAPLSLSRDWLPAVEVRGEGFFLRLDEARVRAWEARPAVHERGLQLQRGFAQWASRNRSKLEFPGARFYLLHSLAHLLMSAVSLECGYPASALRERIYCSPPAGDTQAPESGMAGLLISTGTPGAEGTLGGLVEEGRELAHHLGRALDQAGLCSGDPVCATHRPDEDPADRTLEGAACHGCLFVSESSCERSNQFLDRALVTPVIGCSEAAYFP